MRNDFECLVMVPECAARNLVAKPMRGAKQAVVLWWLWHSEPPTDEEFCPMSVHEIGDKSGPVDSRQGEVNIFTWFSEYEPALN